MTQLNLHTTPEFEADLRQFMARRGIRHKSEAIRQALREAVTQSYQRADSPDFRRWRGLAGGDGARGPRLTDDDLWHGR